MTLETQERVDQLFAEALSLEPGRRESFLAGACVDDAAVRAEVQSLLDHYEGAEAAGLLATPLVGRDTGAEGEETRPEVHDEPAAPPGYEILGVLGRGGMGVVYKARQQGLNRLVALKMPTAGADIGPAQLARFRREAEAVAQLQHPNIVQVYEVGEHAGRCYFSLEYLRGGSLAQQFTGSPLPARRAAELLRSLAWAVHAAHEHGIVHRDLKPANILLQIADDRLQIDKPVTDAETSAICNLKSAIPKITDFGLAKRLQGDAGTTQSGAVMGTPSYMAPEQASGKNEAVGPAADVYALGAILYELLTGRPPFRAGTVLDTLDLVRSEEPVPPRRLQPKTPHDLETIALKCLAKEPERRYPSAGLLAEDLERWLEGRPIQARPVSTWERGVKWVKRRPAVSPLLGVSGLSVLALVALAVGLFYNTRLRDALLEASAQRARAEEQEALVRRYLYFSQINMADRAWREAQIDRMQELLDEQRPEKTGKKDLRGFEWYYLWRLCHSSLLTLRGHTGASVAFSPDGKRLASGSWDNTVAVWDTTSGQEAITLKGHTDAVLCVTFSPDGKRLASASQDGTVKVWDATSGQEVLTLRGHAGALHSVAFSPDGRRLASAGSDKTVRVWNATSGQEALTLQGHTGVVQGVAFSPDGKRLASAGSDKTVRVWDATSGQEAFTLRGHTGMVFSLAFSPDGKRLASASQDETVKMWDATSGREALTLQGHTSMVFSVAFSPDGKRLASAGRDSAVKVWDAMRGQQVLTLRGHIAPVNSVAFRPDGKRLASASQDRTVKVWDATSGQEALALKGHTNRVFSVAFNPDGKRLASASWDNTVKVWDATSGQEALTLKGHTDAVLCVTFSPDGKRLASGSKDGALKLWDATSGQESLALKGYNDAVLSVAFSPAGKRLASAGQDGTVKVWDATEPTPQ
jgi:WD40 repeat protein/serine/threonine protein kinase